MTTHITITGYSKYHRQMDKHEGVVNEAKGPKDYITGYVVFFWDGDKKINIVPDMSQTMTLKRIADLLRECEEKTGNEYSGITVEVEEYGRTKKYCHTKKHNAMVIWENGLPVWENINGSICKNVNALADCYM